MSVHFIRAATTHSTLRDMIGQRRLNLRAQKTEHVHQQHHPCFAGVVEAFHLVDHIAQAMREVQNTGVGIILNTNENRSPM